MTMAIMIAITLTRVPGRKRRMKEEEERITRNTTKEKEVGVMVVHVAIAG